jgi:hypothetical protein
MNRPDPVTFAKYSYILAFVSSGILTVTIILGLIPGDAIAPLRQVMWLALFTSAVGTFLGYAARSDFKRNPVGDDLMRKAGVGFRINLIAFVVMLLVAIIAIVVNVGFLSRS